MLVCSSKCCGHAGSYPQAIPWQSKINLTVQLRELTLSGNRQHSDHEDTAWLCQLFRLLHCNSTSNSLLSAAACCSYMLRIMISSQFLCSARNGINRADAVLDSTCHAWAMVPIRKHLPSEGSFLLSQHAQSKGKKLSMAQFQ